MFLMEGRASESHQLLANAGQTQGDARFLEASVKDSTRFPDTTAVENSFVQYYPALFEAAKNHGTVKPTYNPTKRF
jgi:hypothetical protein